MCRPYSSRAAFLFTLWCAILVLASSSHSDIFEWEWRDPLEHSQGKKESNILCPDGAGLVPAPGMNARSRNLTKGYLIDFDLTGALCEFSNLTNADFSGSDLTVATFNDATLTGATFSGSDLTNASCSWATLTDAVLSGAVIEGANFWAASGFTQTQFESTLSYANGELTGINLGANSLAYWNFSGKTLTDALFASSDLAGADFTGAVITGACFANVSNLTQTQFESTASYGSGQLTGIALSSIDYLINWDFAGKTLKTSLFNSSTLTGTDFTGADLTESIFENATLINTVLTRANLTDSNVRYADFTDASFQNATFTGALISGANFSSTTDSGFTQTQFESTASYAGDNLVAVNLSDNDLAGWVFTGKSLSHASFEGATLGGADFRRAHLDWASFVASTLTGVNFEGALLTNAVLENADLTGASLKLATLSGASFQNSVLTDVDFSDADIDGANLAGAVSLGFTRGQFQSTYSFTTSGNLARINLSDNDLTGWVFTGRDLTDAYFSGATLRGASFYLATLEGTNFSHAVIDGADFDSTTDLGFTRAQFEMTDSYVTGNLAGIGLNRNDMTGWNFAGKNLAGAFFSAATVRDADFSGADLAGASFLAATAEDANFTGADLSGTSFYLAELSGANFTGAVITGADFDSTIDLGFTQSQFESTASYVDGDLANIYLNRNNLIGWNFDGKDLSGAFLWDSILAGGSFRDATLTGTDFTNAVITGADFHSTTDSGFTWAQLESTYNYTVGGLVDLDLSDNALDGWNFESKNLGGTSLADSTLTGANFLDATLTGCDFSGATVNDADFTSTTDSGFTKAQLESTASFLNDDLTGVVLAYNDLAGWDFAGKTLADVSFYNSILTGTDFAGAVITGARFYSTTDSGFTKDQFESTASYASGDLHAVDLGGNDLTEWDFAGKDLTGSDLGDSILTDADFSGAVIAGCSFVSLTDDGLSKTQFESTASYATGRLNGINLGLKDLTGWDFAGKNITDSGWFLATLDGADLSGADARGALDMIYATAGDTTNFVQPDGTVSGLHVAAGEQVRVLDYDGMAGIYVMEGFSIDPEGMLLVGLEDADWGSTIAFDPAVSVVFDGVLRIELCNDFLPVPGDQWQLFDFTGVTPSGNFDDYRLPALTGAAWDTSTLLSDGVLRLVSSLPGDLNGDGFVGSADLDIVRGFWGQTVTTGSLLEGDPSGDGLVGSADLDIVRANWGHGTPATGASVPEPATLSGLLILGLTVVWGLTRRR